MATATAAVFPDQEAACSMGSSHCSMGSSHTLDQLDIRFDDPHAVANAGLLLAATLAERLGIQQTTDALIDLGERPGAAHSGRITRSARRWTLHLPTGWPWAPWFGLALARLRCIVYAT
jgi:hypothetical protein